METSFSRQVVSPIRAAKLPRGVSYELLFPGCFFFFSFVGVLPWETSMCHSISRGHSIQHYWHTSLDLALNDVKFNFAI